MKPEIQIIDPIVKKSDAIRAVGGEHGTYHDLAYLFGLLPEKVRRWKGENLNELWSRRILSVYPTIPYTPKPLKRETAPEQKPEQKHAA